MTILKKKIHYRVDRTKTDSLPITLDTFVSGSFVEVTYKYILDSDSGPYEAGDELISYSLRQYEFNPYVKNTPIQSSKSNCTFIVNDLEDLRRVVSASTPSWAIEPKINYYLKTSPKIIKEYKDTSLTYICNCCNTKFKMKSPEDTIEKREEIDPYNRLLYTVNENTEVEHYCYKCLDKPLGYKQTIVKLNISNRDLSKQIETILKNNQWRVDSKHLSKEYNDYDLNIYIVKERKKYTEDMLKDLARLINLKVTKSKTYEYSNASLYAIIYSFKVEKHEN